jgi:hypothetical protein
VIASAAGVRRPFRHRRFEIPTREPPRRETGGAVSFQHCHGSWELDRVKRACHLQASCGQPGVSWHAASDFRMGQCAFACASMSGLGASRMLAVGVCCVSAAQCSPCATTGSNETGQDPGGGMGAMAGWCWNLALRPLGASAGCGHPVAAGRPLFVPGRSLVPLYGHGRLPISAREAIGQLLPAGLGCAGQHREFS